MVFSRCAQKWVQMSNAGCFRGECEQSCAVIKLTSDDMAELLLLLRRVSCWCVEDCTSLCLTEHIHYCAAGLCMTAQQHTLAHALRVCAQTEGHTLLMKKQWEWQTETRWLNVQSEFFIFNGNTSTHTHTYTRFTSCIIVYLLLIHVRGKKTHSWENVFTVSQTKIPCVSMLHH